MTDLAADTRTIEAEAPQYNARLVRREDMTESLAYFWVRFDGEPTPFEAGQYMTIGVMVDGRIVQRPYSVASPPVVAGTDGYEFYVRSVQGGTFTPLLWRLPLGHKMRMIGPKGKFMLHPGDDRTHIFISSGTGNAPFVSMMRQALHDGAPRKVVFLNGVSYAHELGYKDILEDWERIGRVPGDVHPHGLASERPRQRRLDGPDGTRRDDPGPVLDELGLTPANSVAYICGNPDMILRRRADAARARLPRGPGPQGAVLAEGQGAARRPAAADLAAAIDAAEAERRPRREPVGIGAGGAGLHGCGNRSRAGLPGTPIAAVGRAADAGRAARSRAS